MDPQTTQYMAYNQRRLHYNLLSWVCLVLQFSGVMIVLMTAGFQNLFPVRFLIGLGGVSSVLMAIIVWRLQRLERSYEKHLRAIEEYWREQDIRGIQCVKVTGVFSSRKLVILALLVLGFCLCSYSLGFV